jgi:hypothetical protein
VVGAGRKTRNAIAECQRPAAGQAAECRDAERGAAAERGSAALGEQSAESTSIHQRRQAEYCLVGAGRETWNAAAECQRPAAGEAAEYRAATCRAAPERISTAPGKPSAE